jgi:hypothetical protein
VINALNKERVALHEETSLQKRQTFPPNRNAVPVIQDYLDMTFWRVDRSLTSPAHLRNKTDISNGAQPGGLAKGIPVRRKLLQSASQSPRNVSDLAVAGLPRRPVVAEC